MKLQGNDLKATVSLSDRDTHPKSLRALLADDLVSLHKMILAAKFCNRWSLALSRLEHDFTKTAVVKGWQNIGVVEASQSAPREKLSQTTYQSELTGYLRHYIINVIRPFQRMINVNTK